MVKKNTSIKTSRKNTRSTTGKSKSKKHNYNIIIIDERCKGCKLCVKFCPTNTIQMSKEVNTKGYFVPVVINIVTCKGCNLCSKYCPDFAIYCKEN